jgi:hypothetical protein
VTDEEAINNNKAHNRFIEEIIIESNWKIEEINLIRKSKTRRLEAFLLENQIIFEIQQ